MSNTAAISKKCDASEKKVEKILKDFASSNVDLQAFLREFVSQMGGMAHLAKILAVEIQAAPEGSIAKANLLGKALELVKLAEGGGAASLAEKLSDKDAQAVVRQLLGPHE